MCWKLSNDEDETIFTAAGEDRDFFKDLNEASIVIFDDDFCILEVIDDDCLDDDLFMNTGLSDKILSSLLREDSFP